MNFRNIIILIELLSILYNLFIFKLNNIYLNKPLPDVIKDIYDNQRYSTFKHYRNDKRKISIFSQVLSLLITIILLYSPFYSFIDVMSHQNPYIITLLTIIFISLLENIIDYPVGYYNHFVIEEKYNKNKLTHKQYFSDKIKEYILSLILVLILYMTITFIGVNIVYVYNHLHLKLIDYMLVFCSILLIGVILYIIILSLAYIHLKTNYKFTPLNNGSLKDKILSMLKDCPKKVKKILVYNESAKSTSKNAFVLKLPFYREISIADNFINENDEYELLAILSHEIGHLKHKKTILEKLKVLLFIMIGVIGFILLYRGQDIALLNELINQEFHLLTTNYYLLTLTIFTFIKPLTALFNVLNTYLIRTQEYEADMHAIQNGYGEALIKTFKQISNDQLVNVYPHPIVEFLEYDHPSMYSRISFIKKHL